MSQFEKDLIIEIVKTMGFGGLAFVFRSVWKLISEINATRKDLNKAFKIMRKHYPDEFND